MFNPASESEVIRVLIMNEAEKINQVEIPFKKNK
jgi:hypothetical protein